MNLKSVKHTINFPITNGYKHLQPKVSGYVPIKVKRLQQLCIVEMKQIQIK